MTAEAAAAIPMLEARVDKLTQALLHVAGELWVTRDRQAVLERLLTEGGLDAPALIDGYQPGAGLAEALAAERDAFVARVLDYLAPGA